MTTHWTTGRSFYPGLEIAIGLSADWPTPVADQPAHFVLCLLERGSAWLAGPDGQQRLVSAPAALLFGENLRPTIARALDLHCRCVAFAPVVINDALQFARLRRTPHDFTGTTMQDFFLVEPFVRQSDHACVLPLAPDLAKRLGENLDQLENQLGRQDTPLWPCRSRSYLIESLFMLRLLRDEQAAMAPIATPPLAVGTEAPTRADLSAALLILNHRYTEDWTLERLSRQCCTNRTTLNSYIRRRTGMTMRSYLSSLRMTMAANLLRDTELPISEIVARVGYDSASHFSRAFRELHGMSPAHYRQTTA